MGSHCLLRSEAGVDIVFVICRKNQHCILFVDWLKFLVHLHNFLLCTVQYLLLITGTHKS